MEVIPAAADSLKKSIIHSEQYQSGYHLLTFLICYKSLHFTYLNYQKPSSMLSLACL